MDFGGALSEKKINIISIIGLLIITIYVFYNAWYARSTDKYNSYIVPKMSWEEYCESDMEIGELALVFEFSYERSNSAKTDLQERIRSAYKWGIFFGIVDENEAKDNFENKFGGRWINEE